MHFLKVIVSYQEKFVNHKLEKKKIFFLNDIAVTEMSGAGRPYILDNEALCAYNYKWHLCNQPVCTEMITSSEVQGNKNIIITVNEKIFSAFTVI